MARDLSAAVLPAPVILISTHAGEDYASLTTASPAIGFLSEVAMSAPAIRQLLAGPGRDPSTQRAGTADG